MAGPPSSHVFNLTFDAADPARLARFWADALPEYTMEPPPEGFDTWPAAMTAWGIPEDEWDSASAIIHTGGVLPRLFFQKVPEAKTAKNRLHIDVRCWSGEHPSSEELRRLAAVKAAELVAAGAVEVGPVEHHESFWIVMRDPEGNEFCVT